MLDRFKGVVWPRGEKEGLYRYVVIGIVVTEHPLENLEGKNEVVVEGYSNVSENINYLPQRQPNFILGDASMVLTSLGSL